MMGQARNIGIPVAIALVFLASSAFNDSLSRFFPRDGEIGSWKIQRKVQHYTGEALYEYIDGGAEIYHEYGFERMAVQDYINAAGKSVSVEIFEMTTPEGAYGMYTFKTNPEDKAIPLGNEGRLADYYINFWKGTFLVTLTGFDETGETIRGLLTVARGVEAKLKSVDGGHKPAISSILPQDKLEIRGLKYFKGLLGLRSSHPFFNLEITGFEEGIKGDYADGYALFLIRFGGDDGCRKNFSRLREEHAESQGYEELGESGAFLAQDSRDRPFFVSSLGNYLLIGMGKIDAPKAETILKAIEEKIE